MIASNSNPCVARERGWLTEYRALPLIVLERRWSLTIILHLAAGPKRFNSLRHVIPRDQREFARAPIAGSTVSPSCTT
jgi:hypothetical protein